MSGYTPVFDSIYAGTLCGKWPTAVVWASLLPLCDKNGCIDLSYQAITALTGWPLELLQQGIDALMGADPNSRSTAEEGRRLVLLEPQKRNWGWRVVNHALYREKARLAAKAEREVRSGVNAERLRDRRRPPETADERRRPPLTAPTNANTNEESDRTPSPLRKTSGDLPHGEVVGLDPACWDRWLAYRREIRKPLKPASIPAAQRKLAAFGSEQTAVIEQSIANGWTGLFPLNRLVAAKVLQKNPDGSVALFAGKPVEW